MKRLGQAPGSFFTKRLRSGTACFQRQSRKFSNCSGIPMSAALQQRHHLLEVVPLLATHSDRVTLRLALNALWARPT